jgi:hypothetical protein
MSWHEQAKCAGRGNEYDADAITKRLGASRPTPGLLNITAWRLCRGCTVQHHCAAAALKHNDHGVIAAGMYLNGSMNTRTQLEQVARGRLPPPPTGTLRTRDQRRLGLV